MNLKSSLRLKVTIINILVLVACSVLLTIGTNFLATQSMNLLSTSPSQSKESIEEEPIYEIGNTKFQYAATMTDAAQIEKNRFLTYSWMYMVAVIISGGIATYFATRKSLESLNTLNKEIKDISEDNLSKRISEEETDEEIRGIINSFNKMLNRINDAFESQKQFSANVAHELRTPLAVIQMKLDVFKRKQEKTSEDYEKLLEVIERNNDRLAKVVNELLSISNKDNIELKDKINFSKITESVLNELKELSTRTNIKIEILETTQNSIGEKFKEKEFYGNEQLLYRVIYNLVENAIKYNKEDGNVKIQINKYNDYIGISIKDTGIGISEKDQENIFKPFYRVDKSRSRKMGGSGLGLSIVKNIITQHNGDINIKSSDIGTEFIIKLPYN